MLAMLAMLAAIGRSDRTSQLWRIESNPWMAPKQHPHPCQSRESSRVQEVSCGGAATVGRVVEYARQGPTKPYSPSAFSLTAPIISPYRARLELLLILPPPLLSLRPLLLTPQVAQLFLLLRPHILPATSLQFLRPTI
jgi:hypothetical protein